ncbi:MAG: hypothetical protein KIH62_004110 [Candidatus Kerfeldbacteria bacterium]|nr:hypothetical protein [Candidatus Kerfeldbacteria bacterium]
MSDQKEAYSYKGWLNSNSFIKRAFAVMGYGIMGQLFIMLVLFMVAAMFGGMGALLN